jgi:amino acid adenylation domain-containing protein
MSTLSFLSKLRELDIHLRLEGDRLRLNAPKGALTPVLKEELTARKQDIIAFLKTKASGSAPKLVSVEPRETYPLSYAQQRIWLTEKVTPGTSAFHLQEAVRLKGEFHSHAFERSLAKVAARHESLRTVFPWDGDQPRQKILPELRENMTRIDLEGISAESGEALIQDLITRERAQTFALSEGPLLRCLALHLGERGTLLVITIHHIIFDGGSWPILIGELATLYRAFAAGRDLSPPNLTIQYKDYAVWQKEGFDPAELDRQMDYWRRTLAGMPERLELPASRKRTRDQQHADQVMRFTLSQDSHKRMCTLNKEEGATVFMSMLSSFGLLLSHYARSTDIVIGSPVSGRNRVELESLIGCMINLLVLRLDLSANPSFRQLMQQTKKVVLEAQSHADLPFERLVSELMPGRDPDYNALTQVAFTAEAGDSHHRTTQDGKKKSAIELQETGTGGAQFDLVLSTGESDTGIWGMFNYKTDRFDEEMVGQLSRHFQRVVEQAALHPDTPVYAIPLLDREESDQWTIALNQTASNYPRETIDTVFEEIVARYPDHPAVTYDGQTLTYSEWNDQADRLAARLRKEGVGRDVLVGICARPSTEMIMGMTAILKAGGAYVPLDPDYPAERLRFMIEDSGLEILLTQPNTAGSVPDTELTAISLEEAFPETSSGDGPAERHTPDHLAYVMFTSGSTGKPKGASITHRGVIRLVKETNYIQFEPGNRMPQVSNTSFDAFTFEVWGALLTGGTLVGLHRDIVLSPKAFAKFLNTLKIKNLFLTTALFNQTVQDVPDAFKGLDTLLIGGESLDPYWTRQALEKGSPRHFFNVYGPTENTTFSSTFHMNELPPDTKNIPIGRPITNTKAYILDPRFYPVPQNVLGELCLGGDGLARNYHRRPGLTADRFVPNPFATSPGERLYKTGDLTRWITEESSCSAQIEFHGRIDHQIKVRGMRIEPGEIEAAIQEHSGVIKSIVVKRGEDAANARLVAYVQVEPELVSSGSIKDSILDSLVGRLPEFLIPSAWVILEKLPLTPNGKVDTRALPDPGEGETDHGEVIKPRDDLEVKLVAIWEETLKVRPIGVTDNFFKLGGHSLVAVRLMDRIENAFHHRIPLSQLFNQPTVENMALLLRSQGSRLTSDPLVPIRPSGSRVPFFCVHPGSGDVFTYIRWAQMLDRDRPFYALQDPKLYDTEDPYTSIPDLADRYIESLRKVYPEGPFYLGGWSFGGHVAFEMACKLQHMGLPVPVLFLIDTMAPKQLNKEFAGADDTRLLAIILSEVVSEGEADVKTLTKTLEPLDKEAQLAFAVERFIRQRTVPGAASSFQAFVHRALALFRERIQAIRDYEPLAGHFSGTLKLVRAEDSIKHFLGKRLTKAGWQNHADRVQVVTLPGNHATIATRPEPLLQTLQHYIQETEGNNKP